MRVILVGGGYWGSILSRVLCKCGHETVAEINLPEDAARTIHTYAEMFSADAAVIATPPETHAAIAIRALECGLDVMVEKPMAMTPSDAIEIYNLAMENGCVLQVDSTFLHTQAFEYLRKLGVPKSYQSLRLANGPDHITTPAGWDLAVHDISILCGLSAISPGGSYVGRQSADGKSATASIKLNNGGQAHILASRSWYQKERSIVLRYENESYLWERDALWRLVDEDRYLIGFELREVLENVIDNFAARCKLRSLTGLTDGAHGVQVCIRLAEIFGVNNAVAKNSGNKVQSGIGAMGQTMPGGDAVQHLQL